MLRGDEQLGDEWLTLRSSPQSQCRFNRRDIAQPVSFRNNRDVRFWARPRIVGQTIAVLSRKRQKGLFSSVTGGALSCGLATLHGPDSRGHGRMQAVYQVMIEET